jgi:hypothetical protein
VEQQLVELLVQVEQVEQAVQVVLRALVEELYLL